MLFITFSSSHLSYAVCPLMCNQMLGRDNSNILLIMTGLTFSALQCVDSGHTFTVGTWRFLLRGSNINKALTCTACKQHKRCEASHISAESAQWLQSRIVTVFIDSPEINKQKNSDKNTCFRKMSRNKSDRCLARHSLYNRHADEVHGLEQVCACVWHVGL